MAWHDRPVISAAMIVVTPEVRAREGGCGGNAAALFHGQGQIVSPGVSPSRMIATGFRYKWLKAWWAQ